MRITRVYTRKGDGGDTGLVGQDRVPKNHARIAAYGSVDELNAALGLARALVETGDSALPPAKRERVLADLSHVQNLLFTLGADLATRIPDRWDTMPVITLEHTIDIETRLDALNEDLPPLEEFVIPAGTPGAAALHLARTICRRAERDMVTLRDQEPLGDAVLPFLNRLSDYLFVLARWVCLNAGSVETTWKR